MLPITTLTAPVTCGLFSLNPVLAGRGLHLNALAIGKVAVDEGGVGAKARANVCR